MKNGSNAKPAIFCIEKSCSMGKVQCANQYSQLIDGHGNAFAHPTIQGIKMCGNRSLAKRHLQSCLRTCGIMMKFHGEGILSVTATSIITGPS